MDKPTPEAHRPADLRRRWKRIAAFVVFLLVVGAIGSVVVGVSWKDHLINWQASTQSEGNRHAQTGG